MADFDPKSIPILDDIIEGENEDTTEVSETGGDATKLDKESSPDDRSLDLFNEAATNTHTDIFEPEAIIPAADSFSIDETETTESALIDYQAEESGITNDKSLAVEQQPDTTNQVKLSEDNATLDTIVDDIVKQLMPDLEQQLRFLVQQALEEKLPGEIIEQITNNKKSLP